METKEELMTINNIRNRVYVIRGQQVMLDSDLAEIYGYEVKRLNEFVAVAGRSNIVLRCQNVIAICDFKQNY